MRYLAVLVFPIPLTRFEQKFEIGEKLNYCLDFKLKLNINLLGVFAFMYVSGNE